MKRFLITIVLSIVTLSICSQNDKQQFEQSLKTALQGDPYAQLYIGNCYINGNGIEKNENKAFEWYIKAAQQWVAEAQDNLGKCYQFGWGTVIDYNKAFEWYMKAAQQGLADAQNDVGWCYEHGIGTKIELVKAFEWYMKGAQQGNAWSKKNVGMCFLMGNGTEKNSSLAFEWFMKAAIQGNAPAQDNVGWCYLNGQGTEKNEYKAFEWFMKAAQQGFAEAQKNIGLCYEYGNGTEKDEHKAFEWFMKAALQGHPLAMLKLGWNYRDGKGVAKDFNKSYEWIKKAADAGYSPAFNDLAYCYMRGWGTAVNKKLAWDWLNKAIAAEPRNPNYIDSKGEFYAMENNVQMAMNIWEEIKKISPDYYAKNNETAFSKYIKRIKGDNIDLDVPTIASTNKNTFAIVIANENYQDVSKVPYAINDGNIFAEYCGKTLGIPQSNISFIKDATLNNIRREINWLKQVLGAYNGDASVILYYAGHGIPDETGKTSYILPIDGIGNDVSTGYSLQDLYSTLSSQPAKHITVFLDACFSGANRDGNMLASARGVSIKT